MKVYYDRQVLGGVVRPTGWQDKGVGRRLTSALRLELTYRSSQAMRISAILFILYAFFFISQSIFFVSMTLTGAGNIVFPIDCAALVRVCSLYCHVREPVWG